MENEIKCPKCGSAQLTANKKGFGVGKAAAGAILTGGIGLLAGGIGSNKILITCLACGFQFKPKDRMALQNRSDNKNRLLEISRKIDAGEPVSEHDLNFLKRTKNANVVMIIIVVAVFGLLLKACISR